MKKFKSMAGFTLLEGLIVVAILAILGSIAFSSYTESMIKSGRSDAKVELNDVAQRLQRCYTANNRYNPADGVCRVVDDLNNGGITSREGFYLITANLAQTTFQLTATPVAGSRQAKDTLCTGFTLNQTGQRGSSGAPPERCW